MARQDVNPSSLNSPNGFSHASVATGNKIVCIAGMVALDSDWQVLGGDDLAAQTRAAMQNIEVAMKELGIGWNDFVRRTIYTLRPREWETIARTIEDVTGGAPNPAQTVVGVSSLALDGLLIEIECTALID